MMNTDLLLVAADNLERETYEKSAICVREAADELDRLRAEVAELRERLRPRDPAKEPPPVGEYVLVKYPNGMWNVGRFLDERQYGNCRNRDGWVWLPMPAPEGKEDAK